MKQQTHNAVSVTVADKFSFLQGTSRLPTSESSPATGYLSCVQKPEAVVHAMKVQTMNDDSPFFALNIRVRVVI